MSDNQNQQCPACHGMEFFEGPHGGASINVMCAKCRCTFNWMGPFGLQPIPEVEGVYKTDAPKPLRTFMSTTQAIISLGMRIEQLERELEMHERAMLGAQQIVADTKDRLREYAGWHSPSFIQMYMGYMVGKLHLEHVGKQALLDCFAEFETMMAKERNTPDANPPCAFTTDA